MLYDMILMCNDIECLRAKRWFAIAIRHGQPGFAALRCSSYCCHQSHWPLAGNCVSRRASEFERNYWHVLFFFFFLTIYIYIYTVSLRAVPFMIFYLLCVLCPLPASRIHLHRGCVLRARSQALCECHPVRHAARISTSYKGVNACYWLLLHHIASLCHATDPTDDANHIFFGGQSQNVLWGKIWQSCSSLFWEEWWSTTWGILVQFATKLRSLFISCDTTYDMFF